MSKKTKKAETPEVEVKQAAYVKELAKKGVVVLIGRSQGELEDLLASIPADINYYTGTVSHYIGTGLYRVQVNLKEN